MKAKLLIEGKEFDIEILDEELQKMISPQKTGYERVVEKNDAYYFDNGGGYVGESFDPYPESEGNNAYKAANYYTSKQVAENNVRADKLMRQLRRFAVEHRESDIVWDSENLSKKYCIRFGHGDWSMWADSELLGQEFGMIIFDSKEACNLAIETFHDELIWYFTEYKDSL